jgi:phage tail-like protein
MFDYPLTGFHFLVSFELFPQVPGDMSFQEVSGLVLDVNLDTYNEGGENRFVHRLPGRTKYQDLVLKRGMTPAPSGVTAWVVDATENFNYTPTNLLVSLLDENHIPVTSWYVVHSIPIKAEISSLNAEDGKVVIESLTLRYEYFKTLSLSSAAALVADLLATPAAPSKGITALPGLEGNDSSGLPGLPSLPSL